MQKSITRQDAPQRKSLRTFLYVAMPTIGLAIYIVASKLYEAYAVGILNQ
jgi:hypothetical protein